MSENASQKNHHIIFTLWRNFLATVALSRRSKCARLPSSEQSRVKTQTATLSTSYLVYRRHASATSDSACFHCSHSSRWTPAFCAKLIGNLSPTVTNVSHRCICHANKQAVNLAWRALQKSVECDVGGNLSNEPIYNLLYVTWDARRLVLLGIDR